MTSAWDSVVGAGYISAILSRSDTLVADYRRSFSADELLDALTSPLCSLGLYLGYVTHTPPPQVGDRLTAAYVGLARRAPAAIQPQRIEGP